MPILHLFLVAVIQGLTEFLPISSSAHLILLPKLTGLTDQGQNIDIAVHIGTLGAVVLYFWKDVWFGLTGLPRLFRGKIDTKQAYFAYCLIIATIPVIIVGLILKVTGLEDAMRSIAVIGWAMLIFGLVLYWFDQKSPTTRTDDSWNVRDAIIMGLCQVIALIPGTSRSGITITGGRALGFAREDAARLSMMMSIPTILAAGTLTGIDVASTMDAALARDIAIAAVFAFVSALLALSLMMRLLHSVSFTPYVIYRVVLGVLLLVIAYS